MIVRPSALGATRQSDSAHITIDTRICTHSIGVGTQHRQDDSEALKGSMLTGPQQDNVSRSCFCRCRVCIKGRRAPCWADEGLSGSLPPRWLSSCTNHFSAGKWCTCDLVKGYSAQRELTPDIRAMYPHSYFASLQRFFRIGQAFM